MKSYEKAFRNGKGGANACSSDLQQHRDDRPVSTISNTGNLVSPGPNTAVGRGDIDDNPLTENIAYLAISPEGDKSAYPIDF